MPRNNGTKSAEWVVQHYNTRPTLFRTGSYPKQATSSNDLSGLTGQTRSNFLIPAITLRFGPLRHERVPCSFANQRAGYRYPDTRRFAGCLLFFVQRRRETEARQGFRAAGLHDGLAPCTTTAGLCSTSLGGTLYFFAVEPEANKR
jgi:hypothetical protein